MTEYQYKDLTKEQNAIIEREQKCLPGKPVSPVQIARALGLAVWKAELPASVSGAIKKKEDGSYHIYANGQDPEPRRRFTYAHELAHYLLHKEHLADNFSENVLFRSNLSNDKEVAANKLAADILMPFDVLNKIAETREHNLEELAKIFGVSRTAMMVRLGIPGR